MSRLGCRSNGGAHRHTPYRPSNSHFFRSGISPPCLTSKFAGSVFRDNTSNLSACFFFELRKGVMRSALYDHSRLPVHRFHQHMQHILLSTQLYTPLLATISPILQPLRALVVIHSFLLTIHTDTDSPLTHLSTTSFLTFILTTSYSYYSYTHTLSHPTHYHTLCHTYHTYHHLHAPHEGELSIAVPPCVRMSSKLDRRHA